MVLPRLRANKWFSLLILVTECLPFLVFLLLFELGLFIVVGQPQPLNYQ